MSTPKSDLFEKQRREAAAQSATNVEIEASEARMQVRDVDAVNFDNQLILAPLTTLGHTAFRRLCKGTGADVTVCEMALSRELITGKQSEWSLLKRHPSEDVFGVQLSATRPIDFARAIELMRSDEIDASVSFISTNAGCPILHLCQSGGGASIGERASRAKHCVQAMAAVCDRPVTFKCRIGRRESSPTTHEYIGELGAWGASAVTVHGRSRAQRYMRRANWDYLKKCADLSTIPFIANGDIYNFEDAHALLAHESISSLMLARGALIKPWIFQEIKERRHIDMPASERLELVRLFCHYALDHFGSDRRGVESARRFLLEWLSFAYRYVPVGLLEALPSYIDDKPPGLIRGRNELETLLASPAAADWLKISEMFLGKPPVGFSFEPKHKSNSYEVPETLLQKQKAEII